VFSNAQIQRSPDEQSLKSSRSYTLSLTPQIIYAQSAFLPALVSSQINTQLEFLAVGSWWILRDGDLQKIPSTREDVFNDDSLPMRDKRSLMRFLRHVLQPDESEQPSSTHSDQQTLKQALQETFKIPPILQSPIQALALAQSSSDGTDFHVALERIRRHVRSVGYFGPGFGAVIAKYGGNAEIAQVACRAQAVGGGIYLLGHGVKSVQRISEAPTHDNFFRVTLTDGTEIRCRQIVGAEDDLPSTSNAVTTNEDDIGFLHSISIVAGSLQSLFPPTSDNGPVPAAAIVLVEPKSDHGSSPIYLQVHSEDSGECPSNQCKSSHLLHPPPSEDDQTNTYLHWLSQMTMLKSIL
jgi:Rab proteins geranylgeranyltransferase component A